jgi:hypothetical protein
LRINGYTPSGIHVIADLDRTPAFIEINGEQAMTRYVNTLRDGGTKTYKTDLGKLVLPRRMQSIDRAPKWNGEDIGTVPQEVLNERKAFSARMSAAFRKIARAESGFWR